MRRIAWLVALVVLPLAGRATEKDPRTKVAVMDVRASGGLESKAVEALSSLVGSEVSQRRDLRVITGSDIRTVLGLEKQRSLLGCADASCLVEIGGALGARYVVGSEVGKFGASLLLTVAVIDATSGQTIARTTKRGATPDAILELVAPAVAEVLAAVPVRTNGPPPVVAAPPPPSVATPPPSVATPPPSVATPPPVVAAEPTPPAMAPEPAPASEPSPAPAAAVSVQTPASSEPSSVPAWLALGVGTAAFVTGGIFEGLAWSHSGERVSSAQADGIRQDAVIGGTGLAVGAGLAILGYWLFPDDVGAGGGAP